MEFIGIGITSFLVGTFGSMIGIGGGIFLVPLLVIAFQIPVHSAISAVLFAMVPYSLAGTIINARNNLISYRLGLALEVPTILGAILGSWLCYYLPQESLKRIFGVVVTLVGILMLRKGGPFLQAMGRMLKKANSKWVVLHIPQEGKETVQVGGPVALAAGLLAGSLAGLLGIGGGWLKTPLMVVLFDLPLPQAVATSIFMITITSFTSASSHFFLGDMDLSVVSTLILSFPLGAIAGSYLMPKLRGDVHKKLLGFGVALAGISMLVSAIIGSR